MAPPFLTPTLEGHGRRLREAVERGGCSILVTGEPGVGKSVLVDHWLSQVAPAAWCALDLPELGQRPPLVQVADHLGATGEDLAAACRAALGGRPLMVRVDPADRVVEPVWRQLIELREALPSLHYLFVARLSVKGQMEPRWMRPLVADIGCRVHLLAFDPGETRAYCEQRLAERGDGVRLTEEGLAALYGRALGYVPLIDQILEESVVEAGRRGSREVDGSDVRIAID
ncbi:MAG: ATP-binding protein, partial [Nitrospirae bacterium]